MVTYSRFVNTLIIERGGISRNYLRERLDLPHDDTDFLYTVKPHDRIDLLA